MMKHQAMNPYLPLYEYVPDGEPHIYDGRLFIYGSHDIAGSTQFCMGDYVVWSAPLDDLGNWKYEGISYTQQQTGSWEEAGSFAAPDCARGADGRYYLFYNRGKRSSCEVAVSNNPQGPFTYLANVTFPDGSEPNAKMFDPGVLVDDDGRIYLYVGFVPTPNSPWANVAGRYSLGFELEADMHTIKAGPFEVLPGCLASKGTEFEYHGFYEASSPRKIGKKYYLVYSSEQSHELCYAISEQPLSGYRYGGCLISNADLGYQGNQFPKAPYGNTHGGLIKVKDTWYIFYHRQTHGIECCRQGCAEPIRLLSNGHFEQSEMTSCGLNNGPLRGLGSYNAAYACNLIHGSIGKERLTTRQCVRAKQPHIFEEIGTDDDEKNALHYIANLQDQTLVGFKYFLLGEATEIEICISALHAGRMEVWLDEGCTQKASEISFEASEDWTYYKAPFSAPNGTFPLFFRYCAPASADWMEFTLR